MLQEVSDAEREVEDGKQSSPAQRHMFRRERQRLPREASWLRVVHRSPWSSSSTIFWTLIRREASWDGD
jgi:hypothetical protein